MSGYRPLLELEGKLLLAAKLQEGLRQAIVETMDEGCPKLSPSVLGDLRQQPATICLRERGIAVCTGIGEQDSSERITNKYVELIRRFLTTGKKHAKPSKAKTRSNFIWLYGVSDSIIRKKSRHLFRE